VAKSNWNFELIITFGDHMSWQKVFTFRDNSMWWQIKDTFRDGVSETKVFGTTVVSKDFLRRFFSFLPWLLRSLKDIFLVVGCTEGLLEAMNRFKRVWELTNIESLRNIDIWEISRVWEISTLEKYREFQSLRVEKLRELVWNERYALPTYIYIYRFRGVK